VARQLDGNGRGICYGWIGGISSIGRAPVTSFRTLAMAEYA